jgi:hypothetical protein
MNDNEGQSSSRQSWWLVASCAVCAIGWLSTSIELSRTRSEVARWELREAVISVTDAQTGSPLLPRLTFTPPQYRFPTKLGFQSFTPTDAALPKQHLRWVSAEPITITVGADGYADQILTIGDTTRTSAIAVALNRKTP